jgi:hypothetical protein
MNFLRKAFEDLGYDTASRVAVIVRAVTGLSLCALAVAACIKVIWFM